MNNVIDRITDVIHTPAKLNIAFGTFLGFIAGFTVAITVWPLF